jgi:hypothetical protein
VGVGVGPSISCRMTTAPRLHGMLERRRALMAQTIFKLIELKSMKKNFYFEEV